MEAQSLYEKLKEYGASDYYPFHMPGHKRNPSITYYPVDMDITEIDGFDNLHHPEEILLEIQQQAAKVYGVEESFYLINGSTAGILAAISATVKKGGTILMARNSHKAAYHGAYLRDLTVEYVYPKELEGYAMCGGIAKEDVERAMECNPAIQAVFITSPTYEGMVSDIQGIAKIVHEKGAILVVDAAHGAHLGVLGEEFPASATEQGADLVIQSLHKTLPAPTQTAILHRCSNRIDTKALRKFLQIYQTSSPSYVFMAAMDCCISMVQKQGRVLAGQYMEELKAFYKKTEQLKHLIVLRPQEIGALGGDKAAVAAMDPSKIVIVTTQVEMTGQQLYQELLDTYHLQMEMAAGNYVIAMTSIMDTKEGFHRLWKALEAIDQQQRPVEKQIQEVILPKAEVVYTISQMEEKETEQVDWEAATGCISGEYRYVYPPGVPILAPGERITEEVNKRITAYRKMGLCVIGEEDSLDRIRVIRK